MSDAPGSHSYRVGAYDAFVYYNSSDPQSLAPRRFPKRATCACDRKCSYGASLVLGRAMTPLSPKPRLQRSPYKKKSTYGGNSATGLQGQRVLPDPTTRPMGTKTPFLLSQSSRPANPQPAGAHVHGLEHQAPRPRLPRRGRPRRKLGRPPQGRLLRSTRQVLGGSTTRNMASLFAAFPPLKAFTSSLLGCVP